MAARAQGFPLPEGFRGETLKFNPYGLNPTTLGFFSELQGSLPHRGDVAFVRKAAVGSAGVAQVLLRCNMTCMPRVRLGRQVSLRSSCHRSEVHMAACFAWQCAVACAGTRRQLQARAV